MREIRPSGLEGGVRLIPHPYPYRSAVTDRLPADDLYRCAGVDKKYWGDRRMGYRGRPLSPTLSPSDGEREDGLAASSCSPSYGLPSTSYPLPRNDRGRRRVT